MHELSIAQNIVETIQRHIPEQEWDRVLTVRLKIGAVAGVVQESLEFSFQVITTESPFRHTRLEIESLPFRIQCHTCGTTSENEDGYMICGTCGNADVKILSGTELKVAEIEMAEPEEK